ncbi:MAG TPA: hypothetical protein VNT79_06880 [Phycisphaerae bacterium]|nr:hypothetical protein [Phycisphaerae bacterium]
MRQYDEKGKLANSPRALDVVSAPENGTASANPGQEESNRSRPWLGVLFDCCGVYVRIYRDPAIDVYNGRCPRCGTPITVKVSPDGENTSFVRATLA